MRTKLKEFLGVVETEYKEAKRNYETSLKAAQEVAASAALSPSQSGDRFHSQSASDLAKQIFENVADLKYEVGKSLDEDTNFIKPPCFVSLGGDKFYLVDYPVLISGYKIVSSKSPLGQELLGKKNHEKVNRKEILEIG